MPVVDDVGKVVVSVSCPKPRVLGTVKWLHADWSLGVWRLHPDRLQSFACNMVSVKLTAEQQELENASCKRPRNSEGWTKVCPKALVAEGGRDVCSASGFSQIHTVIQMARTLKRQFYKQGYRRISKSGIATQD